MKICAQRKAPPIFLLPMVPCASSTVTRVSLAFRARLSAKNEALEEEADMIQPLKEPFQRNFGQHCSVPNYLSRATPRTIILKWRDFATLFEQPIHAPI